MPAVLTQGVLSQAIRGIFKESRNRFPNTLQTLFSGLGGQNLFGLKSRSSQGKVGILPQSDQTPIFAEHYDERLRPSRAPDTKSGSAVVPVFLSPGCL